MQFQLICEYYQLQHNNQSYSWYQLYLMNLECVILDETTFCLIFNEVPSKEQDRCSALQKFLKALRQA